MIDTQLLAAIIYPLFIIVGVIALIIDRRKK